jgi:hypothetical protein
MLSLLNFKSKKVEYLGVPKGKKSLQRPLAKSQSKFSVGSKLSLKEDIPLLLGIAGI